MFNFAVGYLSPFIVIIAYAIAEFLKRIVFKNEDEKKKYIPAICAVIGAVIAVVLYFFYPQGIGDTNVIAAITDGLFSGLAATGCNQIYKQIAKSRNAETEYLEEKARQQAIEDAKAFAPSNNTEDHDA